MIVKSDVAPVVCFHKVSKFVEIFLEESKFRRASFSYSSSARQT